MVELPHLRKIVCTYELPDIETSEDGLFGSLRLAIQVVQLPEGGYAPRVLRKDKVNVEPAYLGRRHGLQQKATVEILVPEESIEWESLIGRTEEEAIEKALMELNRLLSCC